MGPNHELPRPTDTRRFGPPLPDGDADTETVLEPGAGVIPPGTIIGAFTIEALLGQGGMATVYRARQEEPRRLVALKVIRADRAANDTYRRRFLAERETLAALEHPAIVPIYAAGEADGVLFLAMRLVDGPDLQSRIVREGRLTLSETIRVLEPIADAVDYAHRMGVIHRDLKPSNIILDRDGRPYLTDFGLGKWLEADTEVSIPGIAIGTLDYMAPEQLTGPTASERAPAIDLYALGCVAYVCLTGRPPFVRDTPQQLMYAHAHDAAPAITSLRPELPPPMDEIFAQVLAKQPTERYASARAFVAALEAAETPSAPPPAVVVPAQAEAPPAAAAPPTPSSMPAGAAAPLPPPAANPTSPRHEAPVPTAAPPRQASGGRAGLVGAGAIGVAILAAIAVASGLGLPGPSPSPSRGAVATARPTVTPRPPTQPPVTVAPTADPNAFPNEAEQRLLQLQPAQVAVADCERFEDRYEAATAMIICPGPETGDAALFFALYEDADAMTADYDAVLSNSEVPDETDSACQELVSSNHGWSYLNNGGQPGRQQGWLGCFPRAEPDFEGVQYVWTHEELLVMGLWHAPGYEAGLEYFDAWATAVRP